MKSMKVLGQSVDIPDSRISYNQYRLMFQAEADQAVHRFEQLYRQNQNLDDVIKHAPQQISDSIQPAVQLCVDTLVKHQILTIDAARFEEQYPDYQAPWTDAYFKLSDQYAEIVMDQESLDAYRVARRKGRARWSGGGFGVSGALKGAATAGAFNMVAGAGHMLFNGMGKLISSAAASSQKNKIYRSPETLSSLSQGVWDSVFYLHGALIDCLSKTGADPLPLQGSVSPVQSREAIAILNNASSIGDSEQCRAALIDAFEKDPYQENWYISAFERFGDDGTLDALARYFGISGLQKEKIRRLDAFAATLPLATEEEAQEAIAQIEQYQQKIRCAEKPEHVQAVYHAAAEFDRQYRTVDGITLPTRDAADLARTEYTAISSIESKIDYDSLSSIEAAEKTIAPYHSPVAAQHQKALHQKWVELDEALRTVYTGLSAPESLLCDTSEEAKRLQPIAQHLQKQLVSFAELDESSLLSFKARLLEKDLPSFFVQCYLSEADSRLAAIDLTLRTALGKEYPTREAAKAAKKEFEAIQSLFTEGNPRKNGLSIKKRIENADFSDEIKSQLTGELFQYENAAELKTAKAFSSISSIILLVIVIGSFFFQLSGSIEFSQKDVVFKGVSLMVTDVQVDPDLSFVDGLKNGLVVFGRCVGDIFVNGFSSYIGGFDYGLIGNILWAFLGLMWVFFKEILIFLPRYFVSLIMTLFQAASLKYYIGYVIGSAIPIAVSQLNFDEETPEENVKRIKGWTFKKVSLVCLIAVFVLVICVYFILNE